MKRILLCAVALLSLAKAAFADDSIFQRGWEGCGKIERAAGPVLNRWNALWKDGNPYPARRAEADAILDRWQIVVVATEVCERHRDQAKIDRQEYERALDVIGGGAP